MNKNIEIKPAIDRLRFPIGNLVIFVFLLIIGLSGCGQKPKNEHAKKNDFLPKDIILKPGITQIIDSAFVFKNNHIKLQSVQVYQLENGILISANRQYFVNDTLNQSTKDIFDTNGNITVTDHYLHFKNSIRKSIRILDEYGNKVILKTEEDGRTNILEYKNEYKNHQLVKVTMSSQKSGNILQTTNYKYDPNGNLLEEWGHSSYLDFKNVYRYNKFNQETYYKHIRNGIEGDSHVNYYTDGVLTKRETYYQHSQLPQIKLYRYNDKKQLISEFEKAYKREVRYKGYDANGNWTIQEIFADGILDNMTKRSFR